MASSDPFDLLTQLTPEAGPIVPGENPTADALLIRILGSGGDVEDAAVTDLGAIRHRRRRRVIVPIIVIGVLSAGGAAAAWIAARRSDSPLQATCLAGLPPVKSAVVVALDGVTDPADACGRAWTDGTLGTDGPPALVSCVDERGMVNVIPGESVSACTPAGWVPFDLTPDVKAAAMAAVNDDVFALTATDPDRCITLDEARTVFRRVLDDHGLNDWTLTDRGMVYDPINRCASISFDRSTRTAFMPSGPPLDE